MFFSSPTSNITPALVSVAMTRSDSRDSNASVASFTSTPAMQISYSTSPSTYRSSFSTTTSSTTRMHRDSSSGWLPSPYRSCMVHRSSSSQGYESSSSAYISDDDLLALDDLAMPPIEYISAPTSAPLQQPKREMTTEEQIAMLREVQEREHAEQAQQKHRAQQQKLVRFAAEQKKTRRSSNLSQRRSVTNRRA